VRGLTDSTKGGKCTGCGGCCGNLLPISSKDKKRIKQHLKTMQQQPTAYEGTALDCPFLTDEPGKRCSIYEARPDICRVFICSKGPDASTAAMMRNGGYKITNMRDTFFKR